MGWVPRAGNTLIHVCELPALGVYIQNGMDWACGCGKIWRAVSHQSFSLYGPTGVISNLTLPTWEEVKPIPVPFASTQAADAFLEGRGAP